MPQPERFPIPKKFDLSATWSCGPRTLQWERLWRRILRNTTTKESRLKEDKPSTDGATDGV